MKTLLLIRNKNGRNFHHALLGNKFGCVEESLRVLKNLPEVFGKDQEFFVELTQRNEEIPDEIKNFIKLKINWEVNLEVGSVATAVKKKSEKKKCIIM